MGKTSLKKEKQGRRGVADFLQELAGESAEVRGRGRGTGRELVKWQEITLCQDFVARALCCGSPSVLPLRIYLFITAPESTKTLLFLLRTPL